jgi:hypothetical protein
MAAARIGALEIAAVGAADGIFIVARGRGCVPPAAGAAAAGRAKAGVAARGGGAPKGMVLLPTGATGGAGRAGAPGAVGALGAGGAPPMEGRGGGLRGTVGAGGLPTVGRGAKGIVAAGASLPGAFGRRVIRTVSFFKGTAEVLVERPTDEVFFTGGSSFSSWLMGKGRVGRGINPTRWQFQRRVSTFRGKNGTFENRKMGNLLHLRTNLNASGRFSPKINPISLRSAPSGLHRR